MATIYLSTLPPKWDVWYRPVLLLCAIIGSIWLAIGRGEANIHLSVAPPFAIIQTSPGGFYIWHKLSRWIAVTLVPAFWKMANVATAAFMWVQVKCSVQPTANPAITLLQTLQQSCWKIAITTCKVSLTNKMLSTKPAFVHASVLHCSSKPESRPSIFLKQINSDYFTGKCHWCWIWYPLVPLSQHCQWTQVIHFFFYASEINLINQYWWMCFPFLLKKIFKKWCMKGYTARPSTCMNKSKMTVAITEPMRCLFSSHR